MAKKISENAIPDINADWGKDVSNGLPYSGQAVQTFIKDKMKSLDSDIKKKVGFLCWSTNIDASNFYHLWGFASEDDCTKYKSDPEANASLLLVNEALPISTIQGDSYAAYLFSDVKVGTDYVVSGTDFNVNLRFSAVRTSSGDRLNFGANGSLTIQRSTDGGSTWSNVDTLEGLLSSHDYSTSSTDYDKVNIGKYLTSGTQKIRMRASFKYTGDDGTEKQVTSTWVAIGNSINRTSLSIELSTNQQPYTPIWVNNLGTAGARKFPLSYVCNGNVAKTLHYAIYDETNTEVLHGVQTGITSNGSIVNLNVGNDTDNPQLFTHGVKTVLVYLTAEDGMGGVIYSNGIVNRFMVVNEADAKTKGIENKRAFLLQQAIPADKMSALSDAEKLTYFDKFTNYTEGKIFDYALFVPTKDEQGNIIVDVDTKVDVTFYLSNYISGNWTPTADGVKMYVEQQENLQASRSQMQQFVPSVEIDSTSTSLYAYLHVWFTDTDGTLKDFLLNSFNVPMYSIAIDNSESYAPVSGTTFLLNPRTRNNTEKEPARIINTVDNSVVESVFDNFDFQTDGWMSKGTAKMLHIPSGRKLTIKTNPLSQFRVNPKSSMVMEMDFDVENVVNEDDPIFELGETVSGVFRGLRIYPMRGEFWVKSYGDHHQDIDYGWCEGNKIHLTIAFCANVNPVKYGVKYGTPDVHIPGTTSQYYKDPSTTTIGLVKVFINGNKQREIHFNTEDRDEFCTGAMSNGGIVIGTTGADINLYSLRMYANKEFSDADAQTNYIASRSTTVEKKQLADDNDIYTDEVGKSGKVISIDKVQKHGKNTLLWHGQETYFLQTANVNGWFEIKKYDADGNFLPKHSGSLCRTTGIEILSGNISEWNKSLKASAFPFSKAQGSSAKTYWDWNQQFDMSKFKATIRIPRSAFDSSIVISDTKTLDDGSTVVEIYGGDLGADFPLGNTPKQYPIDMTTGLIEVPDGWIDGNGILIGQRGTLWHSNGDEETVDGTGYYRGPCYQVADGTPFCQKLVNKINNASCQQSHLSGVNNIYNDLHTAIVGQNDLQRLGAANGQNVRVSKYTEPFFYFFKPDDGSDILYRGGCTFGGGKMDKATWGYAKKFKGLKSIKRFCMFEGSDNSLTGTDFRVPFIWKPQGSCPDEMTYSTDDEGFGVSEGTGTDRKWSQCWDFDGGATYSADDELADATHKADYPTEDIVSAFAAFHNFVYLHNPAIKAYTQGDGTLASFLTSDQAKDYYTKYWMTQGDDRYRLYRYSFGAAAWVDAGLWVQKSDGTYGWDAVYVNSSEPFKYAFSKFGTTYASLPDKLNEMLRKGVVDDFKARLPLYMDPKSLQTYYDLEIHFFCGTDNCGKNTYFVLSQFDRDIQITLPDGTQETHTGVCRFEMHSDDVDTTMAIDNNGRVTHDYDVDRMHPYNKDDATTTPTYSGMNNVLFNLCEQAWDSDTDNTLRTVMAQIFTIMCTLATERDNIPGWPYEKSQQATVLGALWKYIFFIESYFPMSAYNEQGRIRYEYPETLGFVTARQVKPIWMSQGSMDQYELEFMMRRIVYMVSYAAWGPAGKGGNTGIPDADEGGFAMMGTMLPDGTQSVKLEVEVTAHQTIYPTGNVSGAAGATIDPHVRVRAGQKYTLSLGTNTFEKDTYFYVYLRNYYRSFGNLANISLATDFILNGTRLTEFVVNPDNANKYVDKQTGAETLAFRPNGFSIGTAKNIQHLDLHGLTTLKGDINLKDCTRLVDINTEQTKVSTVEFPETMSLETVKLSDTITGVSLPNQGNLQTLTAEGYADIKTLEFGKNTPDDAIVPFVTLCASSATQDMDIELDNVEWDVSFVMSVLLWMIRKTFKGTGHVTVSSQLTPASVQNVSDILGVECFYDDAPFYVKTGGGNFLTGPQNVISGGTADYQMIVIPRSDYTPVYSLQDYESTTKTDGDTIYNKGIAHINGRTGHLTTDESINDVAVKVQGYYSKDGHNDMDVSIGKTTYPQEIRSIQGAEAITKTGEYTYKAQLMPVVYTGKVDVVWDIVSGITDGMTLVSNGNECTLKVTGSVPVNFNKLVLRATATCGNGSSFTKQKDVFYSQEQPVITTSSNAAVMAVCYKQGWASNANYMLRSECEAVEDLGTAFAGNLLLQHFLELQYFTGLKKIADGAFKGCSQLADFTLPQTVTEIGKDAFNGCAALTSLVIPYVVTIDDGAFKGCSNISTFETGDALTTIGTEILSDAQITELSFGPNVATISLDAFDNCQKLVKVTVSSSRFLTWGMAFKNCQSLAEYAVRNDGTTIIKAENTIIYRTDEQTIVAVPQACTTFTTTGYKIADYAFYWNVKTIGQTVINPSDYTSKLKQENVDSLKSALNDYVADCKCYVFNSKGTKMAEIKSATFEGTYDTMTKGTVTFMDGTTVDISTLNDAGCNFMVYRPAMHIKSFTDDAGREILQQRGKIPIDGGITFREKFIGMFKGYVQNNVLKSQPGRICDGVRTIATYQALAQAGGTGYTQWSYKDWCKENALHLSWFGNTNYEVNIGTGRINNYDNVRNSVTGFTLPMIGTDELYGTRPCVDCAGNSINALNFFHIEGLGELIWEFVIGYRHDANTIYIWDDDTWNESHDADYTVPYSVNNVYTSYVRQMVAGEHFDMIPRLVGGSSTTGYCDGYWSNTNGRLLYVGSSAGRGSICGLSASGSDSGFGSAYGRLGARLAFSGRPVEVEGSKLLE